MLSVLKFTRLPISRPLLSSARSHLSVFSQGNGLYGGLGQGTYEVYSTPTLVSHLKDSQVSSVAAGWAHSAVLTEEGEVYIWGQPYELLKVQRIYRQEIRYGLSWAKKWNEFVSSMVSHGGPSGYKTPVEVGGLPSHEVVAQVACGVALTAVRCESGALYLFGMNDFGQCGVGTDVLKTNVKERTIYNPRRPVGGLSPLPLDFDHKAFEKEIYDDDKYEKGSSRGEEKYETAFNELIHHLPPLPGQEVIDVSLGYSHGAVVTSSGGLLTWGKGLRGQLGNGKLIDVTSPERCCLEQDVSPLEQQLSSFTNTFTQSPGSPTPVAVSCGATHTACLTSCGQVYVFGKFQSDEVKEDQYEGVVREMMKKDRGDKLMYHDAFRPRRVKLPEGRRAIQVSCSAYHTAILLDNYEVYAMGVMISSGDIIPQPIPFTIRTERTNELGEGWDESFVDHVEISQLLKEQHNDKVVSIKGGSSANCTGIITARGRCFTVFFCKEEPTDLFEDAHVSTIPELWDVSMSQCIEENASEKIDHTIVEKDPRKVIDMAIGWHHTLLAVK